MIPNDGRRAFYTQQWQEHKPTDINALWTPAANTHRIGILGAQGTGKTTLANMLAASLRLPRIDETARTVLGLGYKLDTGLEPMACALIWLAQLHEELTHTEFVADRTLVDPIIYSEANKTNWESRDDFFINALSNISYLLAHQHYTTLIYVPIEFEPENDGVRATDVEYQQVIDNLFIKFLNDFDLEYLPVSGSKDERLLQVLSHLNIDSPNSSD